MNERHPESLSEEGLRRREAMLGTLLSEIDSTQAARRKRRRVSSTLALIIVVVVAARFTLPLVERTVERGQPIVELRPDNASEPLPIGRDRAGAVAPRVVVTVVRGAHTTRVLFVDSDPTIVARYAPRLPVGIIRILDDRALLDTLASIDRPAGLIRMGDQVRLTRPVSDAQLALAASSRPDTMR